jgi:hypothetical protein
MVIEVNKGWIEDNIEMGNHIVAMDYLKQAIKRSQIAPERQKKLLLHCDRLGKALVNETHFPTFKEL